MSKYPQSLVSSADMPVRVDGSVIYGAHLNVVQEEIIAIEATLGVGSSPTAPSLIEGGFASLAARLRDMSSKIERAEAHRTSSASVHGVSGSVVGTSDAQTLSNKALESPILSGTVNIGQATVDGSATFTGDLNLTGAVTLANPPAISDFTNAQHDHTDAEGGGRIPPTAVYDPATGKTLPDILSDYAPATHTHSKSQITDFIHDLSSHSGTLPASKVSGLGSAAGMSVPATAATVASATQVVRGDDPRLTNSRTPTSHAASHSSTGSDRITPAAIGAAPASHTHTKAQISDFSHDIGSHTGALNMNRVYMLGTTLAGKLDINAQAADSRKIGGRKITVSQTAPSNPSTYDVWIS